MIEKYVSDLEKANQTFLGLQLPETLKKMENVRFIKVNARMKKFVAEKKYKASTDFLNNIHQEIYDAKPQWEKDQITKELKSLAKGVEIDEISDESERPELTAEYLISIGREDLLEWGSE